ncbi:hypothetical protein [Porticoccus sp.]
MHRHDDLARDYEERIAKLVKRQPAGTAHLIAICIGYLSQEIDKHPSRVGAAVYTLENYARCEELVAELRAKTEEPGEDLEWYLRGETE